MAHLMGLLLGMTAAKLQGLARYWLIETTVEPRTLVAQLYSQMTDEQSVKFLYETLSSRERLVLDRIREEPRGWVSTKELERDLPFSGVDLHMVLSGLDEAGLVVVGPARVSGHEILDERSFAFRSRPSVQLTVARVAPEISSILQRVRSQIEAGDQSDRTLHKLLGELTLSQLQSLASKWRIPHCDQCFKRELMALVEDTISRRNSVDAVLAKLGDDSAVVFRTVCEAGSKIGVESLRERTRISESSLRAVLRSLVSHLILADTYVDGRRFVFAPIGVARDDHLTEAKEPPADSELGNDQEVEVPLKVTQANFAFFFDLLVLTNLLEANDVELAGRDLRLPRWAVSQLKEELAVVAGSGFGPIRLDCLVRVASKLGLIGIRDDKIVSNEKVEEWVALGMAGQGRALFDYWLEDDCWCNDHRGYRIDLDPNKYRCIRKRLLSVLRRCRPGSWYRVGTIVEAVIEKCAEVHEAGRVRAAGEDRAGADYREQVRRVVALSLGTLLYWTGGLSLGYDEGMEPSAISISGMGAWLLGRRASRRSAPSSGTLTILPNFQVLLSGADPKAWRWLLKFAVTVSVGRVSVHQITKRKVQQATVRGHRPEDFVEFLTERNREEVPPAVISSILDWAEAAKAPYSVLRNGSCSSPAVS
ncbi:MAG: helicase-associated domain-containing protein [Chloroflexi bacterium]|nr:helicase-associated domain-containing protein [Chloroflexota bacterium]